MIATNYDPEADVLHVRFGADTARYDSAQEIAPGIFLEFDIGGQPMGLEVISASRRSISQHVHVRNAAE